MNKQNTKSSRFVIAPIVAGLMLAVLATAGWLAQPGNSSADETEPNSSITICKSTDPASEDLVDFDTDIPGMNDADLGDGDCQTQDKLKAGTYEITEDKRTNWILVDIVCEGTDAENVKVDIDKRTVIVDLQKGEDVTCTYFNEKDVPTPTPEDTPTDVPTDTPTNTPTDVPADTATPANTPTTEPTAVPPTATATDVPEIQLPNTGSGLLGSDALNLGWYWYVLVAALLTLGLGVLIKPSYN